MKGPAYRLVTERLIIRCYNPIDAPLLQKSVQESVEHLRPWMPWVKSEPEELQTKIDRLRIFRGEFDLGKNYVMGIFNLDETELIGGTGLHYRVGPDAVEIGYWINVNHVKKGYATETAAALTKVAFEIEGVNRVEIHCDPKNLASAAIPKKLGYLHEATLRKRAENHQGDLIDAMIWSLMKDEYEQSDLTYTPISALDVVGRKIL